MDEVGLGLVEGGHEVIKLALEVGGDGFAATLLLSVLILGWLKRLSRVISESSDHQGVASVLDHLDDGVVERILVLLKPSGKVIGDSCGVVNDSKVSVWVWSWVGFGKLGPLAKHVGHQLFSEGLVSGLGEEGLFLKDGKESHGLLARVGF